MFPLQVLKFPKILNMKETCVNLSVTTLQISFEELKSTAIWNRIIYTVCVIYIYIYINQHNVETNPDFTAARSLSET